MRFESKTKIISAHAFDEISPVQLSNEGHNSSPTNKKMN